jgi:hypothetical protein
VWRERDGGQEIHNRYILTNHGGVSLGAGLSPTASERDTFEDIARLSESARKKRWSQYDTRSQVQEFEEAGPVIIITEFDARESNRGR